MRFYEVKVRIDKIVDTGEQKTVTETYAVDALSFSEAEARVTQEMQPYITGDFEVTHMKRANYTECKFKGEVDNFYLVKYNLITVDEVSGKERKTGLYVLFQEPDIDKAKDDARAYMKTSVVDYEIEFIKETNIVDVFLNTDIDK